MSNIKNQLKSLSAVAVEKIEREEKCSGSFINSGKITNQPNSVWLSLNYQTSLKIDPTPSNGEAFRIGILLFGHNKVVEIQKSINSSKDSHSLRTHLLMAIDIVVTQWPTSKHSQIQKERSSDISGQVKNALSLSRRPTQIQIYVLPKNYTILGRSLNFFLKLNFALYSQNSNKLKDLLWELHQR